MNKQHANLKFTTESETKNQLPFLDTCVIRSTYKYNTKIYRKKTFTGVYLNWRSLTANRYKIGLIRCLANRIWKICSHNKDRLDELEKLKIILYRNDYPQEVVETTINKFIADMNKPRAEGPQEEDKRPDKRFFKLPYVGKKCEDFAFRLKKIVEDTFIEVEFNVAFQSPHTIGKMFPFKDNIKNKLERSNVVYRVVCSCGHDYIGKCTQILSRRIGQHRDTDKDSACNKHVAVNKSHRIDYDNVEILDTADSDKKLQYKELLHILKREPELNKQIGKQSKHDCKTLIIKAHPHQEVTNASNEQQQQE